MTFDEAFAAAGEEMDRALTAAPPVIRGYTAHLAGARGKMIRAQSVLACAEDGEGAVHPDGVRFAAAIELLHLATLVHDDIIDDAPKRRGIPSLQQKFGKRTAVICGDYLLAAALRLFVSVPDREGYAKRRLELPDYVGRICMGELRQHMHNRDFDLGVNDYLRIIRGKTAALFEASFYAGALLCTEDPAVIHAYARLGRYIGMIFQLTDDCIDYDVDEDTAKKPVQSDFEQGVVTLPLIHAMAADPELKRSAAAGELGPEEVARAVRDRGGVSYARWFARRYYDKALKVLEEIDPPAPKKARLAAILEKSYRGPLPAPQKARAAVN